MAHSKYFYLCLPSHGNSLLVNYQLPDLMALWQSVCSPSLEVSGGKARVTMAKERGGEGL